MEPRISIITLGVSDLTRSIRFYRDGLGFPTKVEEGAPIAFFTISGVRLSLYPFDRLAEYVGADPAAARPSFGGIVLAHNVRKKEEVAKALSLAEKAGGRIIKPAEDVFWGGHSGVFADPDGYQWEVAWGPMFSFDETGAIVF
jgi:catechol 2,3-dioxygenase-like lactoylglutathione lyase family enzyme